MSINNNSEILFLYDAKMTNPNGDMDNENKPRMDYDTDTNLVSDVRLKRYLRDYFEDALGKEIFVTEKAAKAEERGKQLEAANMKYTDLIDVRLFGAVYASAGANTHLTGPVQFNWGYSLNPVEINESSTITSSFSSGEGVGKDFRVKYSLIAFNGGINANVSESTELSEEDIKVFDEAMVMAIPFNRTRSKMGQFPRLYLRVQAKDKRQILKDLREFVSLEYKTENEYKVRSVKDYAVDITKLGEYLKTKAVDRIFYWKDEELEVKGWEEFKSTFNMVSIEI